MSGVLSRECRKSCGNLALVAGALDLDFETEFARPFVEVLHLIVEERVVRIEQRADSRSIHLDADAIPVRVALGVVDGRAAGAVVRGEGQTSRRSRLFNLISAEMWTRAHALT